MRRTNRRHRQRVALRENTPPLLLEGEVAGAAAEAVRADTGKLELTRGKDPTRRDRYRDII
jgi:hypothetical protein